MIRTIWTLGWLLGIGMLTAQGGYGQAHDASYSYTEPADTAVRSALSRWRDLKFGLFMHWGAYSQWGIVESWSLCPEDEDWCRRTGPHAHDWYAYKQAYEALPATFNPVKFNPEAWAQLARKAGMRYVVFTTKHHDGFCMFDTRQTDYRITGPNSAFAGHPRSNITREIFTAFRAQGMLTGAYFSKPDWHTDNYWWRYFPPKDRNVSYDPSRYPERWQAFKDFTYRQIEELMTGYGRVDILWLDGGWVRPQASIDTSVSWQRTIPYDQDIDMDRIAAMARRHQPGLMVVDRTVPGQYENYVTPEQGIPDHYLPYPWEACLTMGDSWSYVPNDRYKSATRILHLLTTIVSRGGNLLLNVGPSPEGTWDPAVHQRLEEIGRWMERNGEAIHGTIAKPETPGKGKWVFTHKGRTTYAIYQCDEGEAMPEKLVIPSAGLEPAKRVGSPGFGNPLRGRQVADGLEVQLPAALRQNALPGAWVFRLER